MYQLVGVSEEKPFECVGSRDEINTALCIAVEKNEKDLPYLLREYVKLDLYREYRNRKNPYENYYNEENLLPLHFKKIINGEKDNAQ